MRTAFWNYDRTMPLCDGRVDLGGLPLEISILRPEQTFAMAYQGEGFDICEASLSNALTATSKGECPYVLVPAFVSRAFRHGSIFVRADGSVTSPADLAGKAIGLQEYDMTAAVVVRGLLRDDYGIESSSIDWRVGDVERLKPLDFPLGRPPAGVSLTMRPQGPSLEEGLLSGELDAIISLRTPQAALGPQPSVRRLFDDLAERDWFGRSGIFPIMHAIGIKRSVADANPGLTRKVYDLFKAARDLAIADLEVIQVPKVTLPWPAAIMREIRGLMGSDFWPYGVDANRAALETQMRWSREDGLQARPVQLQDLFAHDCMDT